MLAGILFLALIVAVAVLITVDVLRTPTEAPADRHEYDTEHAIAAARSDPRVRAFSREPAARDQPAPAAAAGVRFGTGPVEVDSFERTDQAPRASDQMRGEMSPPAAGEAAVRGKSNSMYLNLSRRSQALVERQLRLIEGLEHGERDEQRLASLSKLERIAMRMHRNAQNILVLAGQEPTTNWNHPVTLAHLVEAALAEIEDHERVSFAVQPDVAVRGPAVHDAVHLLVELIDNAASFSAGDMPVNITGRILTSGGALIDITDRGIGMAAKEMAYANQQLDNPPAPDIDAPKWMGLLVVARLAARHGIRVRLNPAELGGLTALVWFPDEVLTHYGAAADPGQTVRGQRAAAANSAAFAAAQMTTQDIPARPDQAWSARSAQATVPAQPLAGTRRAPIFDEVESRWSRGSHEAPGPTTAVGPPSSGPPRRPLPAATDPRNAPGLPDRSGATARSWAAVAEEANPGGQDGS
jgi:hypothetical protein